MNAADTQSIAGDRSPPQSRSQPSPLIRRVLSIAGSDSGGGAGIQADLKAFARCGVHGMTAITAITAQNTLAVEGVWQLPPEAIQAQVRAVVHDIGVDAVKTGMLGDAKTIKAVAQAVAELPSHVPLVVDPVMVAESGARLLAEDAISALVELLLPRATVVTPNLAEAQVLAEHAKHGDRAEHSDRDLGASGAAAATRSDTDATSTEAAAAAGVADRSATSVSEQLARALHALGPRVVVVTGGHTTHAADVYYDGSRTVLIRGRRWPTAAAHGSGCTHSAALAAFLARGFTPLDAARRAKRVAGAAVRDGLVEVGKGAGPVDVFGLRRRAQREAASPAGRGDRRALA
ncbi:hydroxymethylpyrimidine/phosphomethylpyrimidine kinase [Thermoleophilum album]|uniref:Hydroxymethylpyrimidine/phosphomethylpyrimidine kinase n=1 Tax=Thermoleophilum album TaxID=29539 RepID=A0A1H6FWF0_THEAL|nr:hydroxymethylpyrimidine/phosphomethylpyrimidine kinase [Thermoleophilum album]